MKNQTKKIYIFSCQGGYTLVEIMISLVISSIVVGAMYSTYAIQRRTQSVQESTSEMQQNIRAAMMLLSSDLKMAGYDPAGTGVFGFEAATTFNNGVSLSENVTTTAITLAFTLDLDGDGTIDRKAEDINGDGHNDLSEMEQIAYRLQGNTLQRYSTRTGVIEWQIVAENIEAVDFNFLQQDGTAATNTKDYRMVQVALLARSEGIDSKYTNTTTYTAPWGTTLGASPFNDHYQRRMLVTSVKLRNMGLQ